MSGQDTQSKVECWDCDGKGVVFLPFRPIPPITLICDRCGGEGLCPKIMLEWKKEGQKYKDGRIGLGLKLRDAARFLNIDVRIISRAERGIINPSILNESQL
jgi:excinuclease UvrABC ATPase subunit